MNMMMMMMMMMMMTSSVENDANEISFVYADYHMKEHTHYIDVNACLWAWHFVWGIQKERFKPSYW